MRIGKFLAVCFLLISLSGCVVAFKNVNEDSLQGIAPGMSKEEVTSSVGEPVEIRNAVIWGRSYEIWVYPVERFFAKKYNPLGYLYYEILFLDGKVLEWSKTKMYSQPRYKLDHHETPEGIKSMKIFTEQ